MPTSVTCPTATSHALRFLSRTVSDTVYWQVIKKDGTLIGNFVGGVTAHAAALTSTGFTVDMTGKTPRVQNYRQYLVESLE